MKCIFAILLVLSFAQSESRAEVDQQTLAFETRLDSAAVNFMGGGDYVGNGGGLGEKNFLWAFENIRYYSKLCLSTETCRLDKEQRKILFDIADVMPKELAGKNAILFASEKKQPGFFLIDGETKIAKTGNSTGTPIYINTDMIYSKNNFGEIEPLTVQQAVAVLIHEVGHHVSSASHAALDLIGVKVSMFMQNRVQTTPLLPWDHQISAVVLQAAQVKSFPQVILTIGDDIYDLSKSLHDSVYCPKMSLHLPLPIFPDLQFGNVTPLGTVFHNVHWEVSSREGTDGRFVILGNLTHICPAGSEQFTGVNSFKLRIMFSTKTGKRGPVLVPNSLAIGQSYDPWFKLIRFAN